MRLLTIGFPVGWTEHESMFCPLVPCPLVPSEEPVLLEYTCGRCTTRSGPDFEKKTGVEGLLPWLSHLPLQGLPFRLTPQQPIYKVYQTIPSVFNANDS